MINAETHFSHTNCVSLSTTEIFLYEPRRERTGLWGVPDQVRHKLGCTAIEDG